jgi:hypothetical protein
MAHEAVEIDEKVDRGALAARDEVEQRLELRTDLLELEIGFQFVREDGVVGEGVVIGVGFEEEVERVDRRHVGGQLDLDLELVGLFRERQPRLKITERVLLPVDEMLLGRDLQVVIENLRAAVRRRAKADDLRPQVHLAVVLVVSDVSKRDVNGHGFRKGVSRNYPVLREKGKRNNDHLR